MLNFITRPLAFVIFCPLWLYGKLRKPSFLIGDDPTRPYLRRWYLIPRNKHFNIYLHHVLRDDEDRALHDHPWESLSLCLKGQLGEVSRAPDGSHVTRTIKAGTFVRRSSTFAHRLFLIHGVPAWTLFVTGPRVREWGFLCPRGWRHWREFTAVDQLGEDTGKGKVGRGCGEMA
jgi:hypothetical protein